MRIYKASFLLGMAMLAISLLLPAGAWAATPGESYHYSSRRNATPAPEAYRPVAVLDGDRLGVGKFKSPSDLFVAADGRVYIVDSGNNRIVVLDSGWQLEQVIESFTASGAVEQFNNPQGIYVTAAGQLFVADTDNRRIVELDAAGQFVRELLAPQASAIRTDYRFLPTKLAVNGSGHLFVIGPGMYEGIIEIDTAGNFVGFKGAKRVSVINRLAELLWKRLATARQREQMALFIPTEYNNLAIDPKGFLYLTTKDEQTPVLYLNFKGENILRTGGQSQPTGDLQSSYYGTFAGDSQLLDIDVDAAGTYSALDAHRGRVFTYDAYGNLLYIYNRQGDKQGAFRQPVAIAVTEREAIVLDRYYGEVTILEKTSYAALIDKAISLEQRGLYEQAEQQWRQVLQRNANYELAYLGIGKSLLRKGEFQAALRHFKWGNDPRSYSQAFKVIRKEWLRERFGYILTAAVICALAWWSWGAYRQRRRPANSRERAAEGRIWQQKWLFPLQLLRRPFSSFAEIKFEQRGSVAVAHGIVALLIVAMVCRKLFTGFIFNRAIPEDIRVWMDISLVLVPLLLWCIANWCLTTVLDGEGKFKEIYIASAYALLPLIVLFIPLTAISNGLIAEEGAFLRLFEGIAVLWAIALLLVGNMAMHQYTVGKTLVMAGLTLLGMGIITFLGLLFFNLLEQVYTFGVSVYQELREL